MFSHVALSDDCEHTVGSCVLAPLLWNKVSISLPSLVDCVCVVIALAGDSSSLSSSASSSSTSALTLFDWWPFDTTISCNSCLQFSETSKITQWQLHFCLQRTLSVIQSSRWSCLTMSSSCASSSSSSANGFLVGSMPVAYIPQCLKHFTTVSSLTVSQACFTHCMAIRMWFDFVISEADI